MIRARAGLSIAAVTVSFTSCAPWTLRPIDSGETTMQSASVLSPAAYVSSIWAPKLLPSIENSAVDARTFLDDYAKSPAGALQKWGRREVDGPVYLSVKGEGQVLSVDTHSKAGLALIDIAPFDRKPDLTIQIGPVLRGTSLRDATGLVRFTDFVNQLQFADVANELNRRVLKDVLAPLSPAGLDNKHVSFAGTALGDLSASPPIRELVPVRRAIQEGQ